MERTRGQNRMERRHSPNGTDTRTKPNGTEARPNETETNRTVREREKRERKRKRKKVLLIHKQVVACPSKRPRMLWLYTSFPRRPADACHTLCSPLHSISVLRRFLLHPIVPSFISVSQYHTGGRRRGALRCAGLRRRGVQCYRRRTMRVLCRRRVLLRLWCAGV